MHAHIYESIYKCVTSMDILEDTLVDFRMCMDVTVLALEMKRKEGCWSFVMLVAYRSETSGNLLNI